MDLTWRAIWPEAWWAARLLSPAVRADAATLVTVWSQLASVAAERVPGEGCQCQGEGPAVARAILDHLWRGQPTGRAELDRFAAVVQRHGLERVGFESAIDALSAPPPRVATWRRLRERLESRAAPLASIVARLLRIDDRAAQVAAAATAMALTRTLEQTLAAAGQARVLLPLDDLVAAGLTDRDLIDGLTPAKHAAWSAVVDRQLQRGMLLFDGAARALPAIADRSKRRGAAMLLDLERRRLRTAAADLRAQRRSAASFTLWSCLAVLPRVMRR